jgi:hypothetical protein
LKLKRTNKDYVKVKEVAENQIRSVLAEEGKMKLLSIAVDSIIESLRQTPDAYPNLILTDDNNENNGDGNGNDSTSYVNEYDGDNGGDDDYVTPNANDEYRQEILMLARNFFNTFMTQTVNHTMNKLEADTTEETEE